MQILGTGESAAASQRAAMLAESQQLVERWSSIPIKGALDKFGFSVASERGKNLNFVEGIKDQWRRFTVSRLLESAFQYMSRMSEGTRMASIGGYEKFVFPTIASVYGNLVLDELISLQPMSAPSGQIFYLDILSGVTKGKFKKGDSMYHSLTGPAPAGHFSDETVDQEDVAVGDGTTTDFSFSLSYTPVRPGTVVITDGTSTCRDDGNGNLVGDCYSGTVNYQTGAVEMTYTTAPADDTEVTATYQYDSEANNSIAEMVIRLVSSTVVARSHKLKAEWSEESAQDLMQQYGLDVEPTIMGFQNNQISRDITAIVLNHIANSAAAGAATWDRNPPAGVQWYFHKNALRDTLVEASGLIKQATGRFRANWFVCDTNIASIIRVIDGWDPVANEDTSVGGIKRIGNLSGLAIYEDPDRPENTGILGRKGATFIEAGYVLAPYLGVFTSDTYRPANFTATKGLMVRAGRKLVDAGQYATFTMTNSG